jgi:hypothetical protein
VLELVYTSSTGPVLKNLYQMKKLPGINPGLITLFKASIMLVVATLVPFFILESYMKTGIQSTSEG